MIYLIKSGSIPKHIVWFILPYYLLKLLKYTKTFTHKFGIMRHLVKVCLKSHTLSKRTNSNSGGANKNIFRKCYRTLTKKKNPLNG